MRFFRLKSKGYFTVEAAVIFSFILYVAMILTYINLYYYNKAILFQDTADVLSYAHEEYNETDFEVKLMQRCERIKKEHPYLSVASLDMNLEKKKNRIRVFSSMDFVCPLSNSFGLLVGKEKMEISEELSISLSDPVEVMREYRDIKEKVNGT